GAVGLKVKVAAVLQVRPLVFGRVFKVIGIKILELHANGFQDVERTALGSVAPKKKHSIGGFADAQGRGLVRMSRAAGNPAAGAGAHLVQPGEELVGRTHSADPALRRPSAKASSDSNSACSICSQCSQMSQSMTDSISSET